MLLHIFHGDAVRKFVLACIWVMASCLLELANGGGFTCGITWWRMHLVFEPCVRVWVCECVHVGVCMHVVSVCVWSVHVWVCMYVYVVASLILASLPHSQATPRFYLTAKFSPQLRDKIWEWPENKAIPWGQGIAILCSCLHAAVFPWKSVNRIPSTYW